MKLPLEKIRMQSNRKKHSCANSIKVRYDRAGDLRNAPGRDIVEQISTRMNCMQTLITRATAAYSPAGMSDVFFVPELMMAATIAGELPSRMPAEFSSEDFETGISMSPSQDDDEIEEEDEETPEQTLPG